MGDGESLEVNLHAPIEERLPVGRGTAIFAAGTCFHREHEIEKLELVVGDARHRPDAWGMPRPDAPERRSGFWAAAEVPPQERSGTLGVKLEARLVGGRTASASLGSIEIHERPPAPALPLLGAQTIVICMATFNPDPEMFGVQIESIRAQSDRDWACLISDDGSDPQAFELIERSVEGDPRFTLTRSCVNVGFYRNFERALSMVPENAGYVALSDQDDRWYPDKLETLRGAIGDARLVYSDLRLVDPDGTIVSGTLWGERRTNHTNLASLAIANTVTGAASLFRRDLLDLALPFPEGPPGWKFHDHWLAGVALASGEIAFVERPLYDYVQHRAAILKGRISDEAEAADAAPPAIARRSLRSAVGSWRAPYFFGYRVLAFQALALLARTSGVIAARDRRALRLLILAERSPRRVAWLLLRLGRGLAGRDETLGMEVVLVKGVIWRWLLSFSTSTNGRLLRSAYDARLPAFDPKDFGASRPRWWPRRRVAR